MEHQASLHRMASYRIHQSLVSKPVRIEDYWSLWSDKRVTYDKVEWDADMLDKIKKAHGIN